MKSLASFVVAFTLVAAVPAMAQETASPRLVISPEAVGVENTETAAVAATTEAAPKQKIFDKLFVAVNTPMYVTGYLDTRSTLDYMRRVPGAGEGNKFEVPFMKPGHPVLAQSWTLTERIATTWLSAKMRGSNNRFLHNTWWLAPTIVGLGNWSGYRHNMNMPQPIVGDGQLRGNGGLVAGGTLSVPTPSR